MLLEAIIIIIAISIVFCCCSVGCYILFQYLLHEEKDDLQPEPEVWEAKHFYDPLPLSTPSPPDNILKPTPYTFKLQNGNGMYATNFAFPHAVINPAVLQYPPGHVLDQQRVLPSQPSPAHAQFRKEKGFKDQSLGRRHSRSRSRSPTPSPIRSKNVWSTNTEFQQPHNYYQQHHRHQNHHQHQQQRQSQRQYVQLTQEHYPVQPRQHQHHIHFPPEVEEYHRQSSLQQIQMQQQQYEPFMASSHATNSYTTNHSGHHSNHHHHKSSKRHKEAVT